MAAADTPSDVLLEPVKRSRVYEHIVEQIHALIREGRWAPGDQIPPERELAERFRVSRTSVREALRALEMQGIIDSRQGGGTFVRTADTEALVPPLAAAILRGRRELAEVLEVRELIEPGIARLAATRATAEHASELETLLERQRECIPADRADTVFACDEHRRRREVDAAVPVAQALEVRGEQAATARDVEQQSTRRCGGRDEPRPRGGDPVEHREATSRRPPLGREVVVLRGVVARSAHRGSLAHCPLPSLSEAARDHAGGAGRILRCPRATSGVSARPSC